VPAYRPLAAVFVAALALAHLAPASPAAAQRVGTLAQWKQRVLDPATLDLQTFPGASANLKFSIDQIRLDETTAKIVVYVIPAEQMRAAAEFYAAALGTPVKESGLGTMGELRIVEAAQNDAKRAGLTIRVEHAQWATGKGQILLRHAPPSSP
jgi:hypothetical protein